MGELILIDKQTGTWIITREKPIVISDIPLS